MVRLLSTVLLLIVLAISCMPVRIVTDSPTNIKLSRYKTYDLYSVDFMHYDSLPYDKNTITLLIEEVKKNMKAKGYLQEENDPDLRLNIGVVVEKETQLKETDPRYDMNYIGQRTYHWEREEKVVGFYEEGAITIDFVDADSNMLIWQGTAIGMVSENPEKMRKRVIYAIESIFKKVPITDGD